MSKIATVATREFIETVRTRAFLISSVLLPLLIIGIIFATEQIQDVVVTSGVTTRTIAVVDETERLLPRLEEQVDAFNAQNANQQFVLASIPPPADEDALAARVQAGELYAYLILPAGIINADAVARLGRADNQYRTLATLQRMLNEAVVAERFAQAEVDAAFIQQLRRPVGLQELDAETGAATGSPIARLMTPFAFMFILFLATFGISQHLLTSLIEEKSSRIVEVLLAAISPMQLMAGKILGMIGVGLVVIVIWGAIGYGTARYQQMAYLVTARELIIGLLYFVPTFLAFGAVLAGIGAAFNSLKEAQTMTFPLSIVLIVPMMLWFQITEHPDSLFSIVLSFIPPVTPFVMMLRVSADPATPLWQIALTLLEMWVLVVLSFLAATKVFRVGLLMHGQPPTLRQLWRWVRA